MKRFSFKLQRLLEIREKKEEEAKVELSKASGAYQYEIQRKQKVLSTIDDYRHEIASSHAQLDIRKLRHYDQYIKASDFAVLELDKLIEEKRQIMEKYLARYTEAKRDRRAVEILKEKALERYNDEQKKEEQAESDEIGSQNYIRTHAEKTL